MLTLAYSRKLADPPAAQARASSMHSPGCVYLSYFFSTYCLVSLFFPPVSFLPSLRVLSVSSSIFIHYYFEVPKKWGVQRGKVFFRGLLRSLLFFFNISTQSEELDGPAAGSFVQKMWKRRAVIIKWLWRFIIFFKSRPGDTLSLNCIQSSNNCAYSSCHFITS